MVVKSLEIYKKITDYIGTIYSSSFADENVFANRFKIPVLTMGPIGSEAHTFEEWVSISSLNLIGNLFVEIAQMYHRS